MFRSAIAFGLVVGLASTAAAVTVPAPLRNNNPMTGNEAEFRSDRRYEYWDIDGTATTPNGSQEPGYLADRYNLTPVDPPGSATSNSVLPQLERAVIEFRGGVDTQGSTNRTYGVHVPNAATGLPPILGGDGIHRPLTKEATLNASSSTVSTTNQINVPWTNFQQGGGIADDLAIRPPPVLFSIARAGSTLTVQIGDQSSVAQWDHLWSATSSGFTEINGIQLRMSAGGSSTWQVTDLRYNGDLLQSTVGGGLTSTYQADTIIETAAFTEREIFLWDKIAGDFTLTGNIFLGWANFRPISSTANMQFKLLALPDGPPIEPVPEPSSWVMLIAGFGLVGASLRRRRTVAA